MPTRSIAVGLTETVLVNADSNRTSLILSNPDGSAIIYVSDEQGTGLSGIPIFNKSTLAMSIYEGVDVRKQLWVISDTAAKTLRIREDFFMPTQAAPSVPDIQNPASRKVDPSI